jgi:hypothetical protein
MMLKGREMLTVAVRIMLREVWQIALLRVALIFHISFSIFHLILFDLCDASKISVTLW